MVYPIKAPERAAVYNSSGAAVTSTTTTNVAIFRWNGTPPAGKTQYAPKDRAMSIITIQNRASGVTFYIKLDATDASPDDWDYQLTDTDPVLNINARQTKLSIYVSGGTAVWSGAGQTASVKGWE